MALVPAQGLRWKKESYDAKPIRRTLSLVEVQKRALPGKSGKRPEFLGVMADVASLNPKDLDWHVDESRGRIRVAANGAFAWDWLSKTNDGAFLISEIYIAVNND